MKTLTAGLKWTTRARLRANCNQTSFSFFFFVSHVYLPCYDNIRKEKWLIWSLIFTAVIIIFYFLLFLSSTFLVFHFNPPLKFPYKHTVYCSQSSCTEKSCALSSLCLLILFFYYFSSTAHSSVPPPFPAFLLKDNGKFSRQMFIALKSFPVKCPLLVGPLMPIISCFTVLIYLSNCFLRPVVTVSRFSDRVETLGSRELRSGERRGFRKWR